MKNVKNPGVVLALWAMVFPLFLLLAGIILFSGSGYIRQAELDHLARQSGKSASLILLDALEVRSQEIYEGLCLGEDEETPDICTTGTVWDFLEGPDIAAVILDTQFEVWNEVKQFAVLYDPSGKVEPSDVVVAYPADFSHDETTCLVRMNVEIYQDMPLLLPVLDNEERNIKGAAKLQIDLSGN